MANNKDVKNNRLFIFLIVATFIFILIAWRFYLGIFSEKKEETNKDLFWEEIIYQGSEVKEGIEEAIKGIKSLHILDVSDQEEIEADIQNDNVSEMVLTEEEKEKLKEKIFEHIEEKILRY